MPIELDPAGIHDSPKGFRLAGNTVGGIPFSFRLVDTAGLCDICSHSSPESCHLRHRSLDWLRLLGCPFGPRQMQYAQGNAKLKLYPSGPRCHIHDCLFCFLSELAGSKPS